VITLAQAGNATNRDILIACVLVLRFEDRAKPVCALQMARHVAANPNVGFWRRRQPKVRKKAGNAVQAGNGYVYSLRQRVQLLGRQETELLL
jgi:hypothetical protein